MEFRISDTFTESLSRLTGQEQKAVKTTAFDLQLDPAAPGMKFHRLAEARDPNFWSVRVNASIRLIVHRPDAARTDPQPPAGDVRPQGLAIIADPPSTPPLRAVR